MWVRKRDFDALRLRVIDLERFRADHIYGEHMAARMKLSRDAADRSSGAGSVRIPMDGANNPNGTILTTVQNALQMVVDFMGVRFERETTQPAKLVAARPEPEPAPVSVECSTAVDSIREQIRAEAAARLRRSRKAR